MYACMLHSSFSIRSKSGQDRTGEIARWPMLFFFVQYIPIYLRTGRLCVVYTEVRYLRDGGKFAFKGYGLDWIGMDWIGML